MYKRYYAAKVANQQEAIKEGKLKPDYSAKASDVEMAPRVKL